MTSAIYTWEVRWFLDGAAPARVVERFAGERGQRRDTYLIIPNANELGIKLREGRLEVKGRLRSESERAFAPAARGQFELWSKWSYDAEGWQTASIPQVQVGKTRYERHYVACSDGTFERRTQNAAEEASVHVEVAQLRVGSRSFWSFGLEYLAKDGELPVQLPGLVTDVVSELQLELPAAECVSYPGWLVRLQRPAS